MSIKEESIQVVNEILESKAIVFHDQYGTPYIAPKGNGTKVVKINSTEFKSDLSGDLWSKYGDVVSPTLLGNVTQTLSGIARHEGISKQLDVRTSFDGDVLHYDCGNNIIQITHKGWKIDPSPPIVFRRYTHQKRQVIPVNGDIKDLLEFVNITDEDDKLLFLVFAVSAFINGFPHPILILHGPQGAGKSTPMRIIKELVDPSAIQGVSAPKDLAMFAQLAAHHSVLMFDNLSAMPTWFSDALARASTGDGFSKRALYTDDDDVVYRIQKVIMMNGINQVVTKADLLDRSILLAVKRIEPENRVAEDEFWKKFNYKKAGILGAIFATISIAMDNYRFVQLDNLPRMADFTKWGYAIAEAAGYSGEDFVRAYTNNINKQNEEAIEASPVAQALIEFMNDKAEWSGTAALLLQHLNRIGTFNDLKSSILWPKDPQWLSKRINEVEPNLQTRGINFTRYIKDLSRVIHLTNSNVNNTEV